MSQRQPSALRVSRARLRSFLWRFRTLRWAEQFFANVAGSLILERRFYGFRLTLDVSRSSVQRLLYLEGERFIAERQILRRLLGPGISVVDVGANIGYYALLFARLTGPEGRILAVEPEPDNLIELRRNLTHNRIAGAEVIAAAAGREDGETWLERGINGRVSTGGVGGVRVALRRLDTLLAGRPVDLIKIDVEGYEGEVLAGAAETLAGRRPDLFVEVHPTLLAPPTTMEDLFAVFTSYPHRLIFSATTAPGLGTKVAERYGLRAAVRPVEDEAALLAACAAGLRSEPFWVTCSVRPLAL